MPELKLQTIKIKRSRSGNGHANGVKLGPNEWLSLPYEQMIMLVEKLVGPRPEVPVDITFEQWSSQAIRVLKERYFLKDDEGNSVENVEQMCWRVAWELARAEVKYGKTRDQVMILAREFYKVMGQRWFLPNSPTLMNAGKGNGLQYSACYVIPVPDSLPGIFDGVKYQGLIHQSGGGTGFSFSRLRPRGARVKSTMGVSSGPVGFMRIYNAATQEIKQGGMRRGANMGILRIDHPDVMEFIHCKDDGVGITNFNISLAVTDRFMEALGKDEEYELIAPQNRQVVGKLRALDVWQEIAESAWRTGDPGMIFIDRINASDANPIRAQGWEVESTNPCVTGDTLVSTGEGLVRMEEVVKSHFPGGSRHGGNMAMVFDKRAMGGQEGGLVDTSVFKFYDVGEREVFRLTTKSGFELRATANHRMLTTKGWVELKDLKADDKVLIQSGEGRFGVKEDLPFEFGEGNLPIRWSAELGQVLGWLVGDGWLRTGDKNCRVGFTFGERDEEIMQKLGRVVNGWYGKEIKPVKRLRHTYHLSYHAKFLVEFFLKLGVKAVKADEKGVPESIYMAPRWAVIGFLQGLFSSDGTVRDSKKSNSDWVALTSKSKKLLQDVQLLLLQLGIKSRIFDRSRKSRKGMFPYVAKDGSKRSYTTDGKLYELGIFGEFRELFKEKVGFLNGDKQLRLGHTRHREKRRLQDPFVDRVLEVRKWGVERVYDVTEPISHSVVINGLVSHQCGEQPLYPFDACNLGSIFLNYFVKDKQIEWDKLREVVHTSTRMLDNVIEMNPFPLPQIADTVKKIRRIGLGVAGFADMLVKLEIPFDSEEALMLAEKMMKFINEEGHKESQALAFERGAFSMWKESVYADGKPMRNSTVTTIAPTGSIGILADTSGGIEPLFAIAYQHIVKIENRTLTFMNPLFEKVARERGFWSEALMKKVAEAGTVRQIEEIPADVRAVFGTAHEIAPDWHVKMQAAFQKYTDNAVSKTINLPHNATVDDVKRAYMLAWETGCRGITVFRDGCKSEQVLNLGTQAKKEVVVEQTIKPRPVKVQGATYRIETPLGTAFITVNHDEDGNPFELFVAIGKAGSEVSAMAEAIGRLVSTTLRFGNHMPARERALELMDQLAGIGGGRSVGFGPGKVRSLPDAVARALAMHLGVVGSFGEETKTHEQTPLFKDVQPRKGDLCPKCGEATLAYEEGCKKCYSCGYSEC